MSEYKDAYKGTCDRCYKDMALTTEAKRAYDVRHKYGLPWEGYISLYSEQNGGCAICGVELSLMADEDAPPVAHVDHDHDNGEVRGLLCGNCNRGLGFFKDSVGLLGVAIGYLVKSRK